MKYNKTDRYVGKYDGLNVNWSEVERKFYIYYKGEYIAKKTIKRLLEVLDER